MLHTRRACLCLAWGAVSALSAPLAWAQTPTPPSPPPPELQSALPQALLQGEGRLRFLGLRIYDARLWVQAGFDATRFAAGPVALELRYARSLQGRLIAERSLTEMARSGPLDEAQRSAWLAQMTALFPDVNAGDRITGVLTPKVGVAFYLNGRALGEVREPRFAERFMGIWLSPDTSEPALRTALLTGGRVAP